jgi:hypothetical protein
VGRDSLEQAVIAFDSQLLASKLPLTDAALGGGPREIGPSSARQFAWGPRVRKIRRRPTKYGDRSRALASRVLQAATPLRPTNMTGVAGAACAGVSRSSGGVQTGGVV